MANGNPFAFIETLQGLIINTKVSELSSACLADGEVDYWVTEIKKDLDKVSRDMKARLVKRRTESPFDA